MNVDWAVSVSVFLIIIGIAFGIYWSLFEARPDYIGASLEDANKKVLDFLGADSWSTPVFYNSSSAGQKVLYMDFSWPEGTGNSTHISSSGVEMDCMIQGGRVYFQADVQAGPNHFQMDFMNISNPLLCDYVLDITNASQATPWASEKSSRISQSKVSQMLASEYGQFKQSLGITRNLRVEAGSASFGPQPPASTSTYVKESYSSLLETGQPVSVRVMVW